MFGLLVEGAVDLLGLLLVPAFVLEDGGFSSMSVLLPVYPDLVLGPDVNHVWSDILKREVMHLKKYMYPRRSNVSIFSARV